MANSIFWAGGKVWWRWKLQQRGFVHKVRMWRKPFSNLAKNDFCKLVLSSFLNLHICEETLLWNLRQRHRGPWQSGGQRFKPRENMKIALSQFFFGYFAIFPPSLISCIVGHNLCHISWHVHNVCSENTIKWKSWPHPQNFWLKYIIRSKSILL